MPLGSIDPCSGRGLPCASRSNRARWLAAGILCGLIAVETAYLYSTQRVDGPLWFEAGAAAALILAVCAATWLCERYATRTRSSHRSAAPSG